MSRNINASENDEDASGRDSSMDSAYRPPRLHVVGTTVDLLRGGNSAGLILAAKLSIILLGFAETLYLWLEQCPQLSQIFHYGYPSLEEADQMVRAAAATSLVSVGCKERALAGFALARSAGYQPDLVVGLIYSPFAGHVWVEVDGKIITDDPEHCRPYEAVMRYT